MVDCLIFSKDRAAQLDLLLRSIQAHAPSLYRRITIMWRASDPDFRWGYELLQHEPRGLGAIKEHWVDEVVTYGSKGFEIGVQEWLLRSRNEPISFLVDDNVFYRRPGRIERLPWSFRGGDYDYPFSLDGVVYWSDDVRHLLEGLTYSNPTELEATGHEHRYRLPFAALHEGEPCLTNFALNRVSVSSGMPHFGVHEYDLNERWLKGEQIPVPNFPNHDQPPHAPLELAVDWASRRVRV